MIEEDKVVTHELVVQVEGNGIERVQRYSHRVPSLLQYAACHSFCRYYLVMTDAKIKSVRMHHQFSGMVIGG